MVWRRKRWVLMIFSYSARHDFAFPSEIAAKTAFIDATLGLEKGPLLRIGETAVFKVDEVVAIRVVEE